MINLIIDEKRKTENTDTTWQYTALLRAYWRGKNLSSIVLFRKEKNIMIVMTVHSHDDALHDVLNHLCAWIIKTYAPEVMYLRCNDSWMYAAAGGHQFVKQNDRYQRVVDDFERNHANCFDEEGYLIHQGNLKDDPFGNYSSSEKGCGWIAVYNLLKILHHEVPAMKVKDELEKKVAFHAMFGLNILHLYRYLSHFPISMKLQFLTRKALLKEMQLYDAGILLYRHRKSNHFICYEKVGEDRYHFYNAVYGRKYHISSMRAFAQEFMHFPLTACIFVKF